MSDNNNEIVPIVDISTNDNLDSCTKFCKNFNIKTDLEVNIANESKVIKTSMKQLGFLSREIEACKPQVIKFNTLCEFCWHYKNYTYFECIHFQLRGVVSEFLRKPIPSQKCVVCKHLGSKSCPLIEIDSLLLKRLFTSFNIKLRIPKQYENEVKNENYIE